MKKAICLFLFLVIFFGSFKQLEDNDLTKGKDEYEKYCKIVKNKYNEKDYEKIAFYGTFYSREFNLDNSLTFGVMASESSCNPKAIHINYDDDGNILSVDFGLMQLNNSSHPRITLEDLWNIETNIKYGCEYLRECMDKTDSVRLAITSYNRGIFNCLYRPETVKASTLIYVERVLLKKFNYDFLRS